MRVDVYKVRDTLSRKSEYGNKRVYILIPAGTNIEDIDVFIQNRLEDVGVFLFEKTINIKPGEKRIGVDNAEKVIEAIGKEGYYKQLCEIKTIIRKEKDMRDLIIRSIEKLVEKTTTNDNKWSFGSSFDEMSNNELLETYTVLSNYYYHHG